MTRPAATGQRSDAAPAGTSENSSAATVNTAEASDLAESARRITDTVASAAARHLTWQTPDSFIAAMRKAEHSDDC
jgi:hypothetical protein